MRTASVAVVLAFALGCDHPCDDHLVWNIELSYEGTDGADEGAEAYGARAADGTFVIAISGTSIISGTKDVRLGDQVLHGSHLSRIDDTGHIVGVVPVEDRLLAVENIGAGVNRIPVVWSTAGGPVLVTYDSTLQPVWTRPLVQVGRPPPPIVSADDRVVVIETELDSSSTIQTYVLSLDPDGAERWRVMIGIVPVRTLSFAANGDVFVFGGIEDVHRRRLAAADGTVVEDLVLQIPLGPTLVATDNGAAFTIFNAAQPVVSRLDTDGHEEWSRTIDATLLRPAVVSATGDLVAEAYYGTLDVRTGGELIVVDASTGAARAAGEICESQPFLAADADHYYTLGEPGALSLGLAGFRIDE